ncbi:MAG: PCRF domain-containing protein, partial [Clostridia bacterium]|nr:PCRF domain-containing protein [Clostridia bacterium]
QQKNILEEVAKTYKNYLNKKQNISEIKLILQDNNLCDKEKQQFEEELKLAKEELCEIEKDLLTKYNKLNAVYCSVVIEVVNNSTEQKLYFDLIKGYQNFCLNNNFSIKKTEQKNTTKLYVSGLNAKQVFDKEKGSHKTSLDTNLCYVFVYEQLIDNDFYFDESDVEFSTMRSGGAGGQHVNTTDSAVRATHKKTSISTVCQNERSQFQNKQKAMQTLREKVFDFYLKKQKKAIETEKKQQLNLIKSVPTKIYDYQSGLIQIHSNKKETVLIKDFLEGKTI